MSNKILFGGLIIVGLFVTVSMLSSKSNSCELRSFDGACCQGDLGKTCKRSKVSCSCDQYCLDGDELRSDCCPDYKEWCRPKKNAEPSCKLLSNNGTCCRGENRRCYSYNLERSKQCNCDDQCIRENDCCKDYQHFCQTPGVEGYFDAKNNLETIDIPLNKTDNEEAPKTSS